MRVLEYKQINKGALVGSMNMQFEEWGGLIIRDITLFQKDGKRWLAFPSRSYEKEGKTEYFQYVRFEDKTKHEQWQQKALKALQDFVNQSNPSSHSHIPKETTHGQLKGTQLSPPSGDHLTPHQFSDELPF